MYVLHTLLRTLTDLENGTLVMVLLVVLHTNNI